MTYRERVQGGCESGETTFFTSSHPPKVKLLSDYHRQHWSLENSEPCVLDVTFGEDSSRIRRGNGPEISAAFRRMPLKILQQDTSVKDNLRGKRLRAGWDTSVLKSLFIHYYGT